MDTDDAKEPENVFNVDKKKMKGMTDEERKIKKKRGWKLKRKMRR